MKRFVLLIIAVLSFSTAIAQERKKFDVNAYRDAQRSYVLSKVDMTSEEADQYFELYFEMRTQERKMFKEAMKIFRKKPSADADCRAAILSCDSISIAIKMLDAEYHKRMMEVIAPAKVHKALMNCDAFDRERYCDYFKKGGEVKVHDATEPKKE